MPLKLSVLTPLLIAFLLGFALAWKIKPSSVDLNAGYGTPSSNDSQHTSIPPSTKTQALAEEQHINKQNITHNTANTNKAQNNSSNKETEKNEPSKAEAPRAKLKVLLEQQRYDEAVQLLSSYENRSQYANLKSIIITHLTGLSGDPLHFKILVEAYLAYDYADTTVLLMNAEHLQGQQAYLEAALQYEYAFSYADSVQEQAKVRQQYRRFTSSVDSVFASGENWGALLSFYEEVHRLSVNANAQRFREAELNLFLDNIALAEQQFTELLDDVNFQSRAQEMLDRIAKDQSDFQLSQEWLALIPLTKHGQHYIAQLNISGSANVSLLLDTGASITSLSEGAFNRIYNRYDFNHITTHQFSTAAGVISGEVYQVEYVELGDQVLHKVDIVKMPIPESEQVDGLLGMNILGQFDFHIDQERGLLKLKAKSPK